MSDERQVCKNCGQGAKKINSEKVWVHESGLFSCYIRFSGTPDSPAVRYANASLIGKTVEVDESAGLGEES
jgi:hypothetical protein